MTEDNRFCTEIDDAFWYLPVEAEKYMKLFCEKTDTARQYVNEWLPIVAASQSVKGNAKEREFLLSWVDVVDYE